MQCGGEVRVWTLHRKKDGGAKDYLVCHFPKNRA